MYLVTAKVAAWEEDFPGSRVEWKIGQSREVHDSLVSKFRNNPASWTVSGGSDSSPMQATKTLTGVIEESAGGLVISSMGAPENMGLEWKYLAGDLPAWTKGAEWTNGYPISTGEITRSMGLHMRMDGSQLTADNGLISRTGLNPALDFSSGRRIGILVYAHRLNSTTAIRLRVGTSVSNYVYYNWATIENTLIEGWNFLVIHSHDTGQIRKIQTGVTMAGWQVGAGTYNIQTTPATYLAVEVRTMRAPNYPILWVGSIFSDGGEAVPKITIGFDITTNYELAETIMDKYGFAGYLSVGRAPYATGIDYTRLYKKGWDIIGHTGRHQNIGTYTERSEILSELKTAKAQARTLGLHRGADLFASPNGSWSNKSVNVLAKAGFKWHRTVNIGPVTQYDSSVGHLNPLVQGAFSCGADTAAGLISRAETLLLTYKANCHFYTHDVESGGDGTNWPSDSSHIFSTTFDAFCARLKELQDQGLCAVVRPSAYIQAAAPEGVNTYDMFPVPNALPITLAASPSIVSNVAFVPVTYIVAGGTVSNVELSFDGTTYIPTGQTGGMFAIEPGCSLRITHTVAPTVTQVRSPDF